MHFPPETIDNIHQQLLKNAHIESGYRDKLCLNSICDGMEIQFNDTEFYATVFERSAFMFEGIVRLHPFVDGNKRTALASIQEYLLENGYIFIMPLSAVRFTIKVASINSMESDRINSLMKDIATWIRYRTAVSTDPGKIRKILRIDRKLINTLGKVSRDRNRKELRNDAIRYWIGSDIYPDNNYYFSDFLEFYNERASKVLEFVEGYSKKK